MGRRPAPGPEREVADGDQRPPRPPAGRGEGRPGMPRPNPAMMPKSPAAFGGGPGGPGGPAAVATPVPVEVPPVGVRVLPAAPVAGAPAAVLPVAVAPAVAASAPGGGGRPGQGRGGRGQTQGAFGRPGGPSRRGRKSKRARRQEFEQMEAPTIGGVRVRKGNGETVRLARGASLTDFAEKIGVDAASLVQMLFSLGEMVTATESVNAETLELLGEELNYIVQVVSPEDEDRELLESFDLEFGSGRGRRGRPGHPAAGRHRHGSRRPRQDQAPRRAAQRQRRRQGGRWHHPAHRCLPGRTPRSTATTVASPSSTPPVTRRSPPCVPAVRSRPTSRSSWSRPTTA